MIFGGGAGYQAAEERAKTLSNVFIHPLLSQDRVSEVYSMGDVALITCKRGVGKSGMPSKTWSIMACNVPIIASFDLDSELEGILNTSGAGHTIQAEEVDGLLSAIISRYTGTIGNESAISSARDYVETNASKSHCVTNYANVILTSSCIETGRRLGV